MRLIAVLMPLLLVGCTSIEVVQPSKIEEASGTLPALNAAARASVGEPLFSQFRYWRKVGLSLDESVNVSVGGGKVIAAAGDFLYTARIEGVTAYCTERGTFQVILGPAKTSCFTDRDGDGRLDQVKIAADVKWWAADVSPAVKFHSAELTIPRPDAMKRELIYQGFSKGVLKLAYREYINDMARPAFFQDATYEIETFPAEVSFKASRLQILRAGNSGIEYKVLSSF